MSPSLNLTHTSTKAPHSPLEGALLAILAVFFLLVNTLSTCLSSSSVCSPTQRSCHLCFLTRTGHHPISSQGGLWRSDQGSGNGCLEPAPSLTQFYDGSVNLVSPAKAQARLWPTDLIQCSGLLPSPFPSPPPSLFILSFLLPRLCAVLQRLYQGSSKISRD